jgi:hypothetical protein
MNVRMPLSLMSVLCLMVLTGLAVVDCANAPGTDGLKDIVPAPLIDFIETGTGTAVESGFIKYAYGNIAEGLYNRSLGDPKLKALFIPLIGKIARAYIALAPGDTKGLTLPGDHGNYLANLNLILGVYKAITGRDDYADLNRRITLRLAAISRAAPDFHFPSFPGTALRWPADQALILYTIKLYDENYRASLALPLFNSWKEFILTRGVDKKIGLPVSEISGKTKYSGVPRGCALSYMILYASKIDPACAGRWFEGYKKYFLKDYIVAAGFRETADERFKADVDSGPIIDGVGSAATAFGIGAAYALGDEALATRLENLVGLGKEYSQHMDARTQEAARDIVAQAIEFNMKSQKYWRAFAH